MLIHLTILSTTLLPIKDEINLGVMIIHLTKLSTTLLLIKKGTNQGVMIIHLTTKMIYNNIVILSLFNAIFLTINAVLKYKQYYSLKKNKLSRVHILLDNF